MRLTEGQIRRIVREVVEGGKIVDLNGLARAIESNLPRATSEIRESVGEMQPVGDDDGDESTYDRDVGKIMDTLDSIMDTMGAVRTIYTVCVMMSKKITDTLGADRADPGEIRGSVLYTLSSSYYNSLMGADINSAVYQIVVSTVMLGIRDPVMAARAVPYKFRFQGADPEQKDSAKTLGIKEMERIYGSFTLTLNGEDWFAQQLQREINGINMTLDRMLPRVE